jgi:diacylglycerol kinase (ATP)
MTNSFSIVARARSFLFAFRGIALVLRTQHNAWLHALATIATLVLGVLLEVSRGEWLALTLAIALVWMAEGFNTAVEALCDVVSPNHHPEVERAKDVAAGAVLIAALGALAVGLMVFAPKLIGTTPG